MLLPQNLATLAKITDTTSTRYALGAVHLERDAKGKPWAVVTDGCRLLATTWTEDKHEDYPAGTMDLTPVPGFETLIPRKSWEEGFKLPPKKCPKAVVCNLVLDEKSANGKVTIGATDMETERRLSITVPEGRFPKWRDIEPNRKAWQEARITVDAKLLAELLAAMVPLCPEDQIEGNGAVSFRIPLDPCQAIAITAKRGSMESVGVIMPMSSDDTEAKTEKEIAKAYEEAAEGAIAQGITGNDILGMMVGSLLSNAQAAELTKRLNDWITIKTKPLAERLEEAATATE